MINESIEKDTISVKCEIKDREEEEKKEDTERRGFRKVKKSETKQKGRRRKEMGKKGEKENDSLGRKMWSLREGKER